MADGASHMSPRHPATWPRSNFA